MKRFFILLLIPTILCGTIACSSNPVQTGDSDTLSAPPETPVLPEITSESQSEDSAKSEAPAKEIKSIDIYLIAGQSNAVGHTKITDKEAINWLSFTNVMFAGNIRSGSETLTTKQVSWTYRLLGCGLNEEYIGPEAGMSIALAEYYNGSAGRTAGIIKLAHGGTSLLNKTGDHNQFGNWVSPSYQKTLDPSTVKSGATGGLYMELLKQIQKNITELQQRGYNDINIKGLYWMQGESDRDQPDEYKKAFTYFASDIRSDLSALMKDLNEDGDDYGASEMAIFIGSLSESYCLNTATAIEVNRTFIQMQRNLCEEIENCYFVDNSQLEISMWDETQGKGVCTKGSNWHHWGQAEMLTMGQNAGKLMLEHCTKAE